MRVAKALRAQGEPLRAIAKRLGVPLGTLHGALRRTEPRPASTTPAAPVACSEKGSSRERS